MQGKMRHYNLGQTSLVALLFAGALGVGSVSARAETIFLTCTSTIGISPVHLTVDLTNKTVNNLPATINEAAIDWVFQMAGDSTGYVSSGTMHYHIDRSAGTETEYPVFHLASGQDRQGGSNTLTCAAGSAPQKKF
jgi:hypothetical protein